MHTQPRRAATPSNAAASGLIEQTRSQQSNLHRYLINIAGSTMADHLRAWNVGTGTDGRTLWHYINKAGQHVTTKAMAYLITGKRDQSVAAYWGIKLAASYVDLSSKQGHRPCLFGEHWLRDGASFTGCDGTVHQYTSRTPVVLVESEKTAVLASFILPQFVWIAAGGTNGLTREKSEHLRGRRVLMLFDADSAGIKAANHMQHGTTSARLIEAGAHVMNSIDGVPVQAAIFGTVPDGYDIADHIIFLLTKQYTENGHDKKAWPIQDRGAA
jgi:hypothetical protein